jgi:hypothetical protein
MISRAARDVAPGERWCFAEHRDMARVLADARVAVPARCACALPLVGPELGGGVATCGRCGRLALPNPARAVASPRRAAGAP